MYDELGIAYKALDAAVERYAAFTELPASLELSPPRAGRSSAAAKMRLSRGCSSVG
ncbi:MAG: hypothetical protein M3350_00690 [Actinomycetota bacterium]|nr:hypothetical protein [Actinomycetota bacterium]